MGFHCSYIGVISKLSIIYINTHICDYVEFMYCGYIGGIWGLYGFIQGSGMLDLGRKSSGKENRKWNGKLVYGDKEKKRERERDTTTCVYIYIYSLRAYPPPLQDLPFE